MGLILAIMAGAGVIAGAAIAKVIADDVREWTRWITRRLLGVAVRRLPEGQRGRYAEEWAAHLAEVPGVIGKLAVSFEFQIAAFIAALEAREMDAGVRLDAWRNERAIAGAALSAAAVKCLFRGRLEQSTRTRSKNTTAHFATNAGVSASFAPSGLLSA